jgi:hypothetical protein
MEIFCKFRGVQKNGNILKSPGLAKKWNLFFESFGVGKKMKIFEKSGVGKKMTFF